MSINARQFREHIIKPVLEYLGLYSKSAENLLFGTAAQESLMGHYLKQIKGPALGVYQMEPNTHQDILENFLIYKKDLYSKVLCLISKKGLENKEKELISNLNYATAMCRAHYLRVREPLPNATDIKALAVYWKKYYNTALGKGTVEEFINNYKKFDT